MKVYRVGGSVRDELLGLAVVDRDWVDAGTRRTAYYSYVAPGDYTFRVIAANADGVWNETGAAIHVTVVPPFWRTWWFVALSALGVPMPALVVSHVVWDIWIFLVRPTEVLD